ncbi:MAG: hypothetical protein ACRDTC_15680 [Pseudonocardiaceae bacterium]
MSDVVSFAEIGGQLVELLPARTVMQTMGNAVVGDVDGNGVIDRADERLARDLTDVNGDGVIDAVDRVGVNDLNINVLGDQDNIAESGVVVADGGSSNS